MNEQSAGLDTGLLLDSLKFLRMKFENTNYPTYEFRQSQLQRVDAASAQIRAGQLSSLDTDLILGALEDTRKNFQAYKDYPSEEFKQNRIQQVNDLIAKVRAL